MFFNDTASMSVPVELLGLSLDNFFTDNVDKLHHY